MDLNLTVASFFLNRHFQAIKLPLKWISEHLKNFFLKKEIFQILYFCLIQADTSAAAAVVPEKNYALSSKWL